MGLFSGITDALGITTDPSKYSDMAQFNPYNIESTYGSLAYDPTSRTFTSSLSPEMQGIQQGLFSQYGQSGAGDYLNLMRQQAAPYNEAMGQGIENRMFSQGLTGASKEYQPGGQMRGFWDSVMNQDMGFQLQADQMAQQNQMNLLNQLFSISNLQNSLFNAGQGMGGLQVTGAGNAAKVGGSIAMNNNAQTLEMFDMIAKGIAGGV